MLKRAGLPLVEARVAKFPIWDIELDGSPRRCRQVGDFGEQLGRAPAQGDEGDTLGIESIEPCIGGELGIEDEVLGRLAMLALPKLNEGALRRRSFSDRRWQLWEERFERFRYTLAPRAK